MLHSPSPDLSPMGQRESVGPIVKSKQEYTIVILANLLQCLQGLRPVEVAREYSLVADLHAVGIIPSTRRMRHHLSSNQCLYAPFP